jgi:hypothetical protein
MDRRGEGRENEGQKNGARDRLRAFTYGVAALNGGGHHVRLPPDRGSPACTL